MDKIKFILQYAVKTNLGRLLSLIVLLIISNGLQNNLSGLAADVSHYAFLVFAGVLLVYVSVFIAYAWVINPIREHREMKAERAKYDGK